MNKLEMRFEKENPSLRSADRKRKRIRTLIAAHGDGRYAPRDLRCISFGVGGHRLLIYPGIS